MRYTSIFDEGPDIASPHPYMTEEARVAEREHVDLIVTWPKARPLQSYLDELSKAEEAGLLINFRISYPPKDIGFLDWCGRPHRCYVTHNGFVRGYNEIVSIERKADGIVLDPITKEPWPEGNYIVRDPKWFPVNKIVKCGFQGWRYFTYVDKKAERERMAAALA